MTTFSGSVFHTWTHTHTAVCWRFVSQRARFAYLIGWVGAVAAYVGAAAAYVGAAAAYVGVERE